MTVSKEEDYANLASKQLLQKLCGNWQIDMTSYQSDMDWDFTIKEVYAIITEENNVFNMKFDFLLKLENGELARFCSQAMFGGNSLADEIPVILNSVGDNYYKAYGGKCRIADNQLHMEVFSILKPDLVDGVSIMTLNDDGSVSNEDKYYDKDGNVSGTVSYKMIRKL